MDRASAVLYTRDKAFLVKRLYIRAMKRDDRVMEEKGAATAQTETKIECRKTKKFETRRDVARRLRERKQIEKSSRLARDACECG